MIKDAPTGGGKGRPKRRSDKIIHKAAARIGGRKGIL